MKLCYFNDWRLGIVDDDAVFDVTHLAKDIPNRDSRDLICGVIERWADFREIFAAAFPFILLMLFTVVLIMLFPGIATWLPALLQV